MGLSFKNCLFSSLVGIFGFIEINSFCPGLVLKWEYFMGIGPSNPFAFKFFNLFRILCGKIISLKRIGLKID